MTAGNASGSRRLPNWLDSWLKYTDVLGSPEIFRKWAGIGILGAVLERKVWARTKGSDLYPNLYIILVGPPGVGKSAVLSQSERLLRQVPELFVAPSSVTTASIVDSLNLAQRKIIRPQSTPNFVQFNSLQIVASELGVFLPAYDPAFMNTLTKLYDGELYEERRRTGKVNHIKIDHPQLSIIGGTTPSYLNSFLPDGAWDQGFTSRTVFIYNGEPVHTDIFSDEADFRYLEQAYIDILHDLKLIAQAFGKVSWTQEAMDAISAWSKKGLHPVPEHGKLTHYNSRRLAHCIKLCILSSISRGSDLAISVGDYQSALDWLLEAETVMPDIFKSMGVSADARAMEDCWYFVHQSYMKDHRPVGEHRLVSFLSNRVPSQQVTKILEIMVRSRMLKQDLTTGVVSYLPEAKQVH